MNMDFHILLILGLALFAASGAGRLLARFRVPGVIVCIAVGIALGRSGAGLIDEHALEVLEPLNYFALGLIGFVVGGELSRDVLRKHGRPLVHILFFGGGFSFASVFLLSFAAAYVLLGDTALALAVSLLLGAVASAADPATQRALIRETRARGPLAANILGMTALSDALAILLFALASTAAGRIAGLSPGKGFLLPAAWEILGAVAAGGLAGCLFSKILDKNPGREVMAGLVFGFILFLAGKSITFNLDMLLCLLAFGFVLVNLRPERSRNVFQLTEQAVQPVFILFFVILGASLDITRFRLLPGIMVPFYILGLVAGRISGIRIGAFLSRAPSVVRKHLPYSLFSQAGIAVGLAVLAVQNFHGEIGSVVAGVVVPAVLIAQAAGPALTKKALRSAGETGLDVTEEDILENVKVSEMLDREPSFVYEDTMISEVLRLFSAGDALYYPVVSEDKKLLGIVSVEGIKSTLMEQELGKFLLAFDIMEPVPVTVGEDASLSEVKKVMESYQVDYLPVLDGGGFLMGFIENRALRKFVSSKLLELQERMRLLDAQS